MVDLKQRYRRGQNVARFMDGQGARYVIHSFVICMVCTVYPLALHESYSESDHNNRVILTYR